MPTLTSRLKQHIRQAINNTPSWIELVNLLENNGALLTSDPPEDVDATAASAGASLDAARADHKHDVSTGSPVDIAVANAVGVSTSLARADHAHKIPDDLVSNALLANMAEATIKGRAVGGGAGDPQDLTPAQATAILDLVTATLKGLVPPPGAGTPTRLLRSDLTWAERSRTLVFPAETNSSAGFQRTRNVGSTANFDFNFGPMPADFGTLVSAKIVGFPTGVGSAVATLVRTARFGGSGEAVAAHVNVGAGLVFNAVVPNVWIEHDLVSVLTGLAAGDRGAININHAGVSTSIAYTAIVMRYTPS